MGEQSDIGSVLADAVRREVGKRLAGVILLSDGAPRAYSPRVELQEAARELARLGYPLYTITFGLPRDKTQARDVAVANLQDHYTVFVKERTERPRHRAYSRLCKQNQSRFELVIENESGEQQVLGSADVDCN